MIAITLAVSSQLAVVALALLEGGTTTMPVVAPPGVPWWLPAAIGVLGPMLGSLMMKLFGAGLAARQRERERARTEAEREREQHQIDRDALIRVTAEVESLREQLGIRRTPPPQ